MSSQQKAGTNRMHGNRNLRQAVADGLLYTHTRLNANQRKTLEATSFRYALVELLSERGLITIDQLDARERGERATACAGQRGLPGWRCCILFLKSRNKRNVAMGPERIVL